MTARLGCGAEWDWQVRTRGGASLVAKPETRAWNMEGGRKLNATGRVELTVRSDCCDTIEDVETGDQLTCYRDGVLVWEGPVFEATRQQPFGHGRIVGFDRSWWLTGHFPAFPLNWEGVDVGTNVRRLLDANAALDPLWALQWENPPAGDLLGEQLSLSISISTSFFNVLDTIADSVIDWTVLGDRLLLDLVGTGVDSLPLLDARSWDEGNFTNKQSHGEFALQVIVAGKDNLLGFWPTLTTTPPFRPPPDPRWGSRDVYIGDSSLADEAACITRAKAEYAVRNPPPRKISVPDGALIDSRIPFEALVPGAEVLVDTPSACTGSTLIAMLLATVDWTVNAAREDSVKIALVEKGEPVAS